MTQSQVHAVARNAAASFGAAALIALTVALTGPVAYAGQVGSGVESPLSSAYAPGAQVPMAPVRGMVESAGVAAGAELPPPPEHGISMNWTDIDPLWAVGAEIPVVDFRTGMTFTATRMGGILHADFEPSTRADTEVFRAMYGGEWAWDRRPVLAYIGGAWVAASVNGMPHGTGIVDNNGIQGQMCMHFLESRTHIGNAVDPDHQRCVAEAMYRAVTEFPPRHYAMMP